MYVFQVFNAEYEYNMFGHCIMKNTHKKLQNEGADSQTVALPYTIYSWQFSLYAQVEWNHKYKSSLKFCYIREYTSQNFRARKFVTA